MQAFYKIGLKIAINILSLINNTNPGTYYFQEIIMEYEAFFKISYGLYIVSSKGMDRSSGFIANTVFQVTADPINFAMCCSKENFTNKLIKDSKLFSVSVLQKDGNPGLFGLFGYKSGKDVDKFKDTEFITGKTGVPIVIEDTIAWFECEVIKMMELPTHSMFIGRVVNNELIHGDREPLTYAYYRDVKKGKAPKNAPTYIKK